MGISAKERYENYIENISELAPLKQTYDKAMKLYLDNQGYAMHMDSKVYLMTIAPALLAFVNWVIEEALKREMTRIYFLSRDGYQMYVLAERVIRERGLSLQCCYLKASRFSMRVPGYHLDMEAAIDSICVGGIDVNLRKILRRGGLTEKECDLVVDELGLRDSQYDILNYHQVIELKDKVRKSKLLREYMKKRSMLAYENAIGYLEQEGLCQDDNYAIVDSGWIGTLQLSIEKLVQRVNPDIKIHGFYFGMYEIPKEGNSDYFHAYYFSGTKGIGRKSKFSNSLFETIVSCTDGTVNGYIRNAAGYHPVENKEDNPNKEQMQRNIDALRCFAASISSDMYGTPSITKLETIAEKNLSLFMSNPCQLEVECYGFNYFSDDVIDGNYKEVAGNLSLKQIQNQHLLRKLLIILGIKKETIHESAWIEGSLARYCLTEEELPEFKKKKEFFQIRLYKKLIFLRKQLQTRGNS